MLLAGSTAEEIQNVAASMTTDELKACWIEHAARGPAFLKQHQAASAPAWRRLAEGLASFRPSPTPVSAEPLLGSLGALVQETGGILLTGRASSGWVGFVPPTDTRDSLELQCEFITRLLAALGRLTSVDGIDTESTLLPFAWNYDLPSTDLSARLSPFHNADPFVGRPPGPDVELPQGFVRTHVLLIRAYASKA